MQPGESALEELDNKVEEGLEVVVDGKGLPLHERDRAVGESAPENVGLRISRSICFFLRNSKINQMQGIRALRQPQQKVLQLQVPVHEPALVHPLHPLQHLQPQLHHHFIPQRPRFPQHAFQGCPQLTHQYPSSLGIIAPLMHLRESLISFEAFQNFDFLFYLGLGPVNPLEDAMTSGLIECEGNCAGSPLADNLTGTMDLRLFHAGLYVISMIQTQVLDVSKAFNGQGHQKQGIQSNILFQHRHC